MGKYIANIDMMIKVVGREVGIRKNVYPKWVRSGKMKQDEADKELKGMSLVYEFLKDVASGKLNILESQEKLFP